MPEITLEESSERLRLALPLMAQNKVPVTPENYWVWYQYIAQGIPSLVETIDKYGTQNKAIDDSTTRELYERFIADPGQEHLTNAEDTIRRLVDTVTASLRTADSEVSRYEESLDECAEELSTDMSAERLKTLVDALGESTKKMHEGNALLHSNLEESREDVEALKREIEQMKAQAKIDPLTKLRNRIGLETCIGELREDPATAAATHCLLIADIDHFKRVNDTYGHIFGDKILKVVARSLENATQANQMAARFGGEEFVIVLPSTKIDAGSEISETIRKSIESGRIVNPKTKKEIERITISIGITEFHLDEELYAVIERADGALYQAKDGGRNRVEIAMSEQTKVAANG